MLSQCHWNLHEFRVHRIATVSWNIFWWQYKHYVQRAAVR